MRTIFTTSWDDGSPLDLRIAELLAKHGLQGTFYVPIKNHEPVMGISELRSLSTGFEIGAHTVHHLPLTALTDLVAVQEISESKERLQDMTGREVRMFCFPRGLFRKKHLLMLHNQGFIGARTVGMMYISLPVRVDGLFIMSTTLQAFPHRLGGLFRNVIKRRNLPGLFLLSRFWDAEWSRMCERLIFF